MSPAELSRKTGIAKQVLSDWMAGAQPRNLEQLYAVAKLLGISLKSLCFSENPLSGESDGFDHHWDSTQTNNEFHGRFQVHIKRLCE
jgi:transcriptional regulator with XRE-family HTH domain